MNLLKIIFTTNYLFALIIILTHHRCESADVFKLKGEGVIGDFKEANTSGYIDTEYVRRTTINSYPYLISLQVNKNFKSRHICAGSLVRPNWVLTAASCVVDKKSCRPYLENCYSVLAGSTRWNHVAIAGWKINVNKIHVHEQFDCQYFFNDIALLQLKRDIKTGENVNLVKLANTTMFDNREPAEVFRGNLCQTAGWGSVQEDDQLNRDLKHLHLPLIPTFLCKKMIRPVIRTHVCTLLEGMDACVGDAGAPLICNDFQIGIVSWGNGCARKDNPGVYTRVDLFGKWIDNVLKNGHSPVKNVLFLYTLVLLIFEES